MNPFDRLDDRELSGLEGLEGLDGFSFSRLIKKVKRTVRKAAKVVAPIAVGMVAGPAAGAAVGKMVLERRAAKKANEEYEDSIKAQQQNQQLIKLTNNPQAPQIAQQAIRATDQLANTHQYHAINQQLARQGYTPQQRAQMFVQSKPVQQIVGTATAASVYGGVRNAGYSPPQAAAAARQTVEEMDKGDTLQKVLPYVAMGIPLLFMAMG